MKISPKSSNWCCPGDGGSAVPVRTSVRGLMVYLQVQGPAVQVQFLLVVAKESAELEAVSFGWY